MEIYIDSNLFSSAQHNGHQRKAGSVVSIGSRVAAGSNDGRRGAGQRRIGRRAGADKGGAENIARTSAWSVSGDAFSGNGMADPKGRDRRRHGGDDIRTSHGLSHLYNSFFYQSVFDICFFHMHDGISQDTGKDLPSLHSFSDGSLYRI